MKDSILIICFFCAGIGFGYGQLAPDIILAHDPTLPALWLLMFLVGLSLGSDSQVGELLRSIRVNMLLLPLATTLGTFSGCALLAIFLSWGLWDCLAVGAGFGYYSLSSIFITQYKGADTGTVALIANVLRELFTLLFTPLLVRFFGPPAAIVSGGATTMDTTLPIITRYSGNAWVLPSVIHATLLDFSVPFWVIFFCSL